MKTVLMDASSSILLYKAGLIEPLVKHYHAVMPPSVCNEITVPGYPGERVFTSLLNQGLIKISPVPGHDAQATWTKKTSLGPGERDTIALFRVYPHAFVLIDDGKGARFCRKQNIPYINALLVPKLLYYSGLLSESEYLDAMARLEVLGRYSPDILSYARASTPDNLTLFLCGANHDTDTSFPGKQCMEK